jgi:hypothetical protein
MAKFGEVYRWLEDEPMAVAHGHVMVIAGHDCITLTSHSYYAGTIANWGLGIVWEKVKCTELETATPRSGRRSSR